MVDDKGLLTVLRLLSPPYKSLPQNQYGGAGTNIENVWELEKNIFIVQFQIFKFIRKWIVDCAYSLRIGD